MNKIRVKVDNIFHKYDTNKSGHLDKDEAEKFLTVLYGDTGLDPSVKKDIFNIFDENKDGFITKQEFIDALVSLKDNN